MTVKMKCEEGHDANVLYLHPRCHPNSMTWTYINQEENSLTVECVTCKKAVATFKLA